MLFRIGKAFSRSNKKSFGGPPNEPEYNTASVHVTFISHQLFRIVNEESLRHLFSQFGPVVDAVICKSTIDQVSSLVFTFSLRLLIVIFRARTARAVTVLSTFREVYKVLRRRLKLLRC